MCGVYGALATRPEATIPLPLFERLGETLRHRGPDEAGRFTAGGIALGLRRLAIVDPERGQQPLASEDGTVQLVCNGEIYNHAELRRELLGRHTFRTDSDLEVLVHLYEEFGLDFLARAEGMFGLALWDSHRRQLVLARDRMGEKPLFYGTRQGVTWFASELRALRLVPGLCDALDGPALTTYLELGYFPSPSTPWAGVRKLSPGSLLLLKPGGGEATPRSWWSLRERTLAGRRRPVAGNEADAAQELRRRVTESVHRQLRADAPVGVALSGGLDSGLITLIAARHQAAPVPAFTVSFSDKSYDELEAARALARQAGARHVIIPATRGALLRALDGVGRHMDEPLGDPAVLPTWLLAHEAGRSVRVLLSGEGADELYGGYPTYFGARAAARYARWPRWLTEGILRPAVRALPRSEKKVPVELLLRKFVDHARRPALERHLAWFASMPRETARALSGPLLRSAEPHRSPLEEFRALLGESGDWEPIDALALMYLDARTYLAEGLLTKLDRISMSASVESRAPFLGRDVVEHAVALPAEWRAAGLNGKRVLRAAAAPLVPAALLKRRKRGLSVPLAALFRHELKATLRDELDAGQLNAAGVLDGLAVESLLARHLSGRSDESRALWNVLMLARWHRYWVTGGAEAATRRPEAVPRAEPVVSAAATFSASP